MLPCLLLGAWAFAFACSDDPDDDGQTDASIDADDDGGDAGVDPSDEPDAAVQDEEVQEDPAPSDPDLAPDQVDWVSSVRFNLQGALDDDFFAFPYPSDLRVSGSGAPDIGSFPTTRGLGNLLGDAAWLVETGNAGFSPLSAAYFVFDVSLDTDTLPADVAETMTDEASVFLFDVTEGSPDYGTRHPVRIFYNDAGGGYWPAHTLAIQPLYGIPLRTATTYAAVVTDAVLDVDGDHLKPPHVLRDLAELLAEEDGVDPMAEHFRPLYETLDGLEGDPPGLAAATVFTTSDPPWELIAFRDWMAEELSPPAAEEIVLKEQRTAYTVYEGHFDSVEFFADTAPYRAFGEGRMSFDDEGEPTASTAVDLTFTLTVPVGTAPEAGWPIVLYGHGLGENHSGFLSVAASGLAERGVAVLGLDPPLQGDRNPTTDEDQDLIVSLAVSNIMIGREILRQGVLDEVRAGQLVKAGLIIPASVAAEGVEVTIDPGRVAFMGHSEGAQIGALLAAIEPDIGAFVLSSGGGGAAITMLELDTAGIDVAEVVASMVGIDPAVETLDLIHPVTAVVIQPLLDVADPLHYARRIFREPRSGLPHDMVMTEGFNDVLTPPNSTEALASAAGLPIAQPVGRAIEASDLQGIGSVALPAHGNLPEVLEHSPTGALLQFPEMDHYVIYRSAAVRAQLFSFLRSSLDGETVLPAP